ncbi:MAG TPA: alanine racemase [Rhodopila sp.]|uniref:alanine racemase n=1 Tax=Rhodopila sp. TaxID=2480087 RepID=UPI002CBF4B2A|nr:alanine racemase [Rhodopila sp.]HVY18341.1 alanine racemase [Rhodopila sp.]
MPDHNTLTSTTAPAVLFVDLGAIVANWRALHRPGGPPVAGVIKADGYGVGAGPVAKALYDAGCRHFFVAWLQEALAIRAQLPDAMIAVLGGLVPGSEAEYVAHAVTPVLGTLDEVDRWRQAGQAGQGRAILHVDTGMSRLGLTEQEVDVLAADPERLGNAPLYVMSHLVSSEITDDPLNAVQLARFKAVRARLPTTLASLANSSGIFLGPDYAFNLVRPGAALYGINPTPDAPNPMRPVVRLAVRVLSVRDIAAGDTVGYNATWTAPRPSRIATAALGYADGFLRTLSGRAAACFDGTPVPLVGRVSMDLTTFDVTDHPAIRPGCWLDVLGPHVTADDVARAAGTNGYEILTSLGPRYQRVYLPA